jgi:hypothetical protein
LRFILSEFELFVVLTHAPDCGDEVWVFEAGVWVFEAGVWVFAAGVLVFAVGNGNCTLVD